MTPSRPADDEAARLAALRRYAIRDTPPEAAFERITRLARQLFGVPVVLISLVDQERQWFKACYGLDIRETGRDLSFCVYPLRLSTLPRPRQIMGKQPDITLTRRTMDDGRSPSPCWRPAPRHDTAVSRRR